MILCSKLPRALRPCVCVLLVPMLLAPPPQAVSATSAAADPPKERPAWARTGPTGKRDDPGKDEPQKPVDSKISYGIKMPSVPVVQVGRPPASDAGEHAHARLTPAQIAERQKAVTAFLKQRSGALTKPDVVKIYGLAGHFSVVHGLLGTEISPERSREIGRLRQEIQNETILRLSKALRAKGVTRRLGVNDFGSGSDPAKVNAKTDIDFTLFPQKAGVSGAELVGEYRAMFKRVTQEYGSAVDPAAMDIVAHRYEATIPDWRQVQSLSDFELQLRQGSDLLRGNPEAYFLEGAYVQQIMGRSVDPGAKTFSWIEVGDDGRPRIETLNAGEVRQFFYQPEVRRRYAFGGAVGNWHFFHAHSGDLAARAKYVLRSVDDGAGLLLEPGLKTDDYADVPVARRQALVDGMYPDLPVEVRRQIRAALDTAVTIRAIKAKGGDLTGADGLRRAYAPLLEYERTLQYTDRGPDLDDDALARLASRRFDRLAKVILVENMVRASSARLRDWLMPEVEGRLRTVRGQVVDVDPQRRQRLQFAAFFELRDALAVMDPATVRRIKDRNPRFRRDIEILEGILAKRREMMLAPDSADGEEAIRLRRQAVADAESYYEQARRHLLQQLPDDLRGTVESGFRSFHAAWARGQEWELWLQQGMADSLLVRAGKPELANRFLRFRERVRASNEAMVSPVWMARIGKANSLVNVMIVYHQQGEVDERVLREVAWQVFSYVPVLGLGMDLYAGGSTAAANIVLVAVVPGYAVVMLYVNTAKGLATLAGTVVFEPIKRDKVLLAYQGYLDPQESGVVLAGITERVESPRPAVLHFVDPERSLSLEERRKRFYGYFAPRVSRATRAALGHGPETAPEDWSKEYGAQLVREVDRYLADWSNGTGEFAGFDSLTVDRATDVHYAADILDRVKRLLVEDFIRGQALAAKARMAEQEEKVRRLLEDMAAIAGRDRILDSTFDRVRDDCATAGDLTAAETLDGMPEIEPSLEILAAPAMRARSAGVPTADAVQLRARVSASAKSHPTPWKVAWTVTRAGATEELAASGARAELPSDRPGPVEVRARAMDASGSVFVEGSIRLEIERHETSADDRPGFVKASDPKTDESDEPAGEREPEPESYYIWVEERGTWCYFGSGTQEEYDAIGRERRWRRKMGGPYVGKDKLLIAQKSWAGQAKIIDIPGHGRKHYVKVGNKLCYLGTAIPAPQGAVAESESPPATDEGWFIDVTILDLHDRPVPGATVKLGEFQEEAAEVGNGLYRFGPLTYSKVRRTPLAVGASATQEGGAGVGTPQRFQSVYFFPDPGRTTAVTIRFPYPMVRDPVPAAPAPAPPAPPAAASEPPPEQVWKFDPNRPFRIVAVAPAKKASPCRPGAEVLDEAGMQVTIEQDGRQQSLRGGGAMEALRLQGCVERDEGRCGWVFTGACQPYGPDYTRDAPPEPERPEPTMSRHDCILKYCPECEGAMLFDTPAEGSPCDRCVKGKSDEIDRCSGGR